MIMRRFTIYILWEVGKLFLLALTAFTAFIMLFMVIDQMIKERLSLLAIVSLVPYILPLSLQYALPATLLFAVCSVYGRIAADNEVLAVKAAGVPPMRIITPTLVFGFLLSPLAVWMMDLAVSWGKPGMNRVIMYHIEEVAYHTLRSTGSYSSSSGFSIYVEAVEGRTLVRPEITIQGSDGAPTIISAQSGELRFIPTKEALQVQLVNAICNVGTTFEARLPFFEQDIPLSKAARRGHAEGRPAEIPLKAIETESRNQRETIRCTEGVLAARALLGLGCGRYDMLSAVQVIEANGALQAGKERLAKLYTEPWRRFASGFSCFCFVWLGVPLAVWCRTADYWSSFGVAFLPLLLIYYPLFALGLEQSKYGDWPPYSVWMGNIALLIVGAYFMRKVHFS